MKLLISVLDTKAHFFTAPITARTEGEAIRIFTDGINDPQSSLSQHPDDYQLYLIAQFDEQDGVVSPQTPPRLLIAGNAVERKQQPRS